MDPESQNSAADIPDDFKTTLAQMYSVLHENGVTRDLFLKSLLAAGYSLDPRTLDRWVVRVKRGESAILENKESGGIPLLDREQRDVAAGWVLHKNETGVVVDLSSFYKFVKTYFGVELSKSTIANYLEEDGFASRLVQKKGKSFVVDVDALCDKLWKWVIVQDFRARGIKREKFSSIDFTFSGHRTERRASYSPKGGRPPMISESISDFTNCLITCVWADGVNRTPPILFTYNSAFRTDRPWTPRRQEQLEHLRRCMEKYGIDEKRIIYVGNAKDEKRTYVKECPALVRLFFGVYEVPPDATIYSDAGNSFFDNGESVLREVGFKKHVTYDPDVHQFKSPNDNRLHGTSKQSWRHSGIDHKDDIESCLALMHFLDRDIVKHSKYWWDRNLIKLTEEGVKDLIGRGPLRLSHKHKSWKRSYEEFMNQFQEDD